MTFVVGTATPRVVRAAFWVLIAGLLVHLASGLAGHGADPLVGTWLYSGLELTAAAVVAFRVLRVPEQRLVWGLFGAYIAMTAAADIVWTALAVDGELAAGSPAEAVGITSRIRWPTPGSCSCCASAPGGSRARCGSTGCSLA